MAGAGGAAEDLGRRLRAVAESLLDEAKSGTPSREMAMTLLAADALITLACEWEAEHDVEPAGERR
jgi:plasmid stabilization system protein ParE